MKAHKFKPGMKLEVVDLEQPHIVRVATITNIMGRMLQLFFDGQQKFQFVDFESPDIYPIGWCKRTGHPLHSPFGPSKYISHCIYSICSITLHLGLVMDKTLTPTPMDYPNP